ncbi:hypothetical protein NHX12_001432 [Muraenolepis orangiensis]|uniref:RRP15-like protein n=1 Tax=Muraenolepis orangiensis TaxID=630683 RepID=A0A9Q0E231_9TELE|nr:hypothetical protein NHX12_001432 [Muraenolepis orangiensis]
MMATASKAHVKISAEYSGEEDEAHHEASDQSDVDGEADEASVDGEHPIEDDGDDDDGDDDDSGDDDGSGGEGDSGGGGSDGEEADDEDKGTEEEAQNPNAGWADVMAKILQKKTQASKPVILVKSKHLAKIKEKEKQERLEQRVQTNKKRTLEMMFRVKPDITTDREAEKSFHRTATRGVVQLFNAVRKHQNLVSEKVKEVGGSDRKKAKLLSSVSKKDFIDVLRGKDTGGKARKAAKETGAVRGEEQPSWGVLRDDFMMGAKMKDWDKQSDGEEEQASAGKGMEDSDSD